MKICILYPFKRGAWGGANQFLKALMEEMKDKGVYESDPYKADVVIFNGNPLSIVSSIGALYKIKKRNASTAFIMRIDGPIFLIRNQDKALDRILYSLSEHVADGIVFQSKWSMERNILQGMNIGKPWRVITNAPNPKLFKPSSSSLGRKVKVVITSWSDNYNKGFLTYQWLDENLDFSRYRVKLIGNSPISFKNIVHINPMNTKKLSEELRENDIYLTASEKDPCSNSLIEALHCNLPVVALNDGGHPELVKQGGELFKDKIEIPDLLDKISDNYSTYQKNISTSSIDYVLDEYCDFSQRVLSEQLEQTRLKKISLLYVFYVVTYVRLFFLKRRLSRLIYG